MPQNENDNNFVDKNNVNGTDKKINIALISISFVLAIVLSVLLTFSITVRKYYPVAENYGDDIGKIAEIMKKNSYYDLDHESMLKAAIKAYVAASGDEYAEYYDAKEFEIKKETSSGRYVGVGIEVGELVIKHESEEVRVLRIFRVYEGTSAEKAGIQVGDFIYSLKINDEIHVVDDVGRDKALSLIRGAEGSQMCLNVIRAAGDESKTLSFPVSCEEFTVKSVTYRVDETEASVGVVHLLHFDRTTPTQFCEAIESLKKSGISKIVIDLRDNGGGDLLSVVACASYFLAENDVIITAEDNKGNISTYTSSVAKYNDEYADCSISKDDIGRYKDLKIAVLVNKNTASAAEILTAVIRDYDLGIVVGTRTYGKGVMQSLYSLDKYGVEGGIKMTTNRYFPPCGESYNEVGIEPHITVEATGDGDVQLTRAIEELMK